MLLSKALEGFLLSKSADGLSPNTLSIYKWGLSKLVDYTDDADVAALTTDDLRRWFVWMRDEYTPQGVRAKARLSVASLQDAWCALKSFYSWAEAELHIARVDDIKRPAGESPPIIPLTDEEVRALLRAAEHYHLTRNGKEIVCRHPYAARNVALVLVMLDTGMRVGELTRLTVADVNIASGEVVIQPYQSGRKTGGRVVYLGKAARRALWRYLSERELQSADVIFSARDGRPLSIYAVSSLLHELGDSAGVAGVNPHRFRHTFSIQFLRNGGNAFVLRQLLGHRSLEMTKRYLRLVNEDAATAMMSASPADRWKL